MSKNWFEISLCDHWSNQPHGIARVTQNLFISSLASDNVGYFYYCMKSNRFVVPRSVDAFKKIAVGEIGFSQDVLPESDDFESNISAGDRVLITGAGWGLKCYLENLRELKYHHGAKLACVIYDIIAVHSPQFFLGDFSELVAGFQREIVSFSDHVACISRHTEFDVRNFLIGQGAQTTSVFTMGADFPAFQCESIESSKYSSVSGDFILTVGTIEARKNHLLLYYVMRKLVQQFGDQAPDLVIVGKVGWLSGDVLELFRRDPLVNSKVHILNAVNDSELEWFYRESIFTVYPSFYEGYGLPILESLGRGKICVCSNTSSMKDINPFEDFTFDPYDPEQAYKIISKLFSDVQLRLDRERMVLELNFEHSWRDAYCELTSWFDGP
jgi:glycosyltransferase involved in cell wall biosynthesis